MYLILHKINIQDKIQLSVFEQKQKNKKLFLFSYNIK